MTHKIVFIRIVKLKGHRLEFFANNGVGNQSQETFFELAHGDHVQVEHGEQPHFTIYGGCRLGRG